MMMSDLPTDLLEEILSRIPATCLKRLTCKRWNALFKEPGFTEKHSRKAPKQSHVLVLKEYRLCPVIVDLNVDPPSMEFKDELSLKDSHSNSVQLDIAQVSHCDGYENNKSGRNYKILMYCYGCGRESTVGGFEIYEFSSNTWRVVNAPNWVRTIYSGVTLKGNTYWISVDDDGDNLLSFDFTGEIFGLPPAQNRGSTALSVVREEKLSVLYYCFGTPGCVCYMMWVSNNLNTEADLSWSKSFEVNLVSSLQIGTGYPPSASLLINEEKKVALCCNSHKWTVRNALRAVKKPSDMS
ncbi:unnamed protein product [Microthlaspi erraticum]|uniref:F-box domain-containing protein n=1 Tax=Microthlaspi erraticum TaxID=1685480 RepID=A0A6D2HAR1_9BRAS|nr:unnamed protein product [Microthlaspi erraticum]